MFAFSTTYILPLWSVYIRYTPSRDPPASLYHLPSPNDTVYRLSIINAHTAPYIVSRHTTSHPVTSHHIPSHHITSQNITSHRITEHHIASRITPHHITSQNIASHHLTSSTPHHTAPHCAAQGQAADWLQDVLRSPGQNQGRPVSRRG